ncbi:hypothetical protein [Streptococcus suis]|nr:hypothetical protein [Streptococcus suis]HEM3647519.1 hypothetical protein [Streptococcus suis]
MVREQTEYLLDDLLADSLQIENYLKQGRDCQLLTIQLGIEQGIAAYLERYESVSPQVRFRIFLFSSCYLGKIERFLEEKRGEGFV